MARKTQSNTVNPAAPVASPAPAPAPAAPAAFDYAKSGASIARSEGQRSRLLAELGEALKGSTYAQWEAARMAFEKGASEAGWAAPADLWQRTVKAGKELGLVGEKPAAPTAGAKKKAAQRGAKAAKLEALAKGTTPAALLTKAAEAIKAGKADEALDLQMAAKHARDAAEKAAREKAADVVKAIKARLSGAIDRLVKAGAVAKLETLAKAAEKASPVPAAAKL